MLPKKLITAFVALAFMGLQSQAQLTIQSGATFNMQSGALVTVQGSVDNAGSLGNEGSLKVQGNYINTGTYSATAGVLEMYGTGNSDMNAGSSPIANLVINKTNPTDIVKLTATAIVNNSLTHTNGVFTTDPIANPSFSITSPVTATYTFAAGKEIVGSVKRTSWTAGAARVFNQPNMLVTTNGGTTPTDFTVTMIPQSGGGNPTQAEREVTRKYTFAQTGGSGFTADVRYPYITSELNTNNENNLVPWRLAAAEWNARLTPVSRDGVNDYVSTTGIPATEMTQEWKLADPNYTMNVTANLRGPWNGVSAMNTTLFTAGIIPLAQPYNTTPFNYTGTEVVGAIPANVVDWVLIEHRKPASGLPADALVATITGREAGFLLNNGTVVELDGVTPIAVPITKQGTAFITIRHRNHLGVLSNAIASNAAGTFINDYTILANSYKPVGAPSNPVVLLAGAGGKYGMWAGDANKSGVVNATDISSIKAAIAGSLTGYQFTDVNLSNSINATDVSLAKSTISLSGTGSGTTARPNNNKTLKTNIPDPILEN
jgi:Dockerin type I domain